MGPNRFLLLRRMSMLPRDLRRETTVTEIATVAIRPARPRAQGIVPGVALHHAGSTGLTHNDVSAGMSDEQDRVVARHRVSPAGAGLGVERSSAFHRRRRTTQVRSSSSCGARLSINAATFATMDWVNNFFEYCMGDMHKYLQYGVGF